MEPERLEDGGGGRGGDGRCLGGRKEGIARSGLLLHPPDYSGVKEEAGAG